MSRLYLVRHGQAATEGADPGLTETGRRQCEALAAHWLAIGRRVERLYAGRLRRQRESAECVARALEAGGAAPALHELPGLEEFDHRALLDAAGAGPGPPGDARALYARLAGALQRWAGGGLAGIEPYAAFRERCGAGLAAAISDTGRGRESAIFGSAGSLAAAMQRALGAADAELVRLTLRAYNTGVSTLLCDGERVTIESLNAIGHLERPELLPLVTHR